MKTNNTETLKAKLEKIGYEEFMKRCNVAIDAYEKPYIEILNQIGNSIGFGRCIQILGGAWDHRLLYEFLEQRDRGNDDNKT